MLPITRLRERPQKGVSKSLCMWNHSGKTLAVVVAFLTVFICGCVARIPPGWLPPSGDRFKLVLPETVEGAAVYSAVLDRQTGLVWQRTPDTNIQRTYDAAVRAAAASYLGGTPGWRLPSMDELMSLTARDSLGNTIIHPAFPWQAGPATGSFWTQTVGPFQAPFDTIVFPLEKASMHGYRYVAVIGGLSFQNNLAHPVTAEKCVWMVRGPGGMH